MLSPEQPGHKILLGHGHLVRYYNKFDFTQKFFWIENDGASKLMYPGENAVAKGIAGIKCNDKEIKLKDCLQEEIKSEGK